MIDKPWLSGIVCVMFVVRLWKDCIQIRIFESEVDSRVKPMSVAGHLMDTQRDLEPHSSSHPVSRHVWQLRAGGFEVELQ